MSMDPLSVVALILSIIAILLWLYSFFFPGRSNAGGEKPAPASPEPEPRERDGRRNEVPDVLRQENQMRILQQQVQWESRFMAEAQKFSQMTRKNLEMLNTRVGIKFDIKPISDDFKNKPRGPEFVDSMDVSDWDSSDAGAEGTE